MSPATPTPPAVPAPPRPRSAYIDTLRGVAIFGVACIHFGGSFVNVAGAWSPSFYLGLFFGQLFNFAVPLFLFLSGLLAGMGSAKPSATLWDYYRGRISRIVVPYLAASAASFYLLNHLPQWQALPNLPARLAWLAQRLCYYGVEPTLYFIPLVLQLYLLQPALKALPGWIHSLTRRFAGDSVQERHIVLVLTLLFLALHVTLGVLCYRNVLSYYDWCRPFSFFWMVYFFGGLHFKALCSFFTRRSLLLWGGLCLVVACGALVSDGLYLTNRSLVGAHFEFNNMDYAYCRPQLLIFDLVVVAALSVGVARAWSVPANALSFLGPYTLDIYLWHILLLYEGAWRYDEVLASCRQMPELILIICAFACLILAHAKRLYSLTKTTIRQYRLVLVKQPW